VTSESRDLHDKLIVTYLILVSIINLRSQLYSNVLYYTRISRHVLANSKPSSGVVCLLIFSILYATTPDDGFELAETCRDIRV
jgi:hypothetical protein